MLRTTWVQVKSQPKNWRPYSKSESSEKSAHAQWYSDLLPGMLPVALLGSAVYLGLQLTREILVHEKYLDEARARVKELEVDVAKLRAEKQNTVVPSTGKSTRSWFGW